MSDEIVKREDTLTTFKRSIMSEKAMSAIANALPDHFNPKKMARVVITAVTRTPKLLECRPETVMNAVIEASQLGLMPDGILGHGYLVPYKTTCVFIPGYKGLLDLARRSGEIAWVQARIVYEHDSFHHQYGMDPRLDHIPARSQGLNPGPMIAAYGIAKYKDGEFHFEVMYKDEIEAIRKRSRAGNDGPWVTDYDEMARKTVIRRLCKFLPMNPEYQNLVARDEYHEAGVLEQYIDVDPATGEVIEDKPESAGDMLNMFADQLEEEKIEDPRFEKKEEEEVEGFLNYEPEPQQEVPDPDPPQDSPANPSTTDAGPATEDTDTLEQGSGRISKEEDAAFLLAVENVKKRMLKVQDQHWVDNIFTNRLNMFKAGKPEEIRARSEREKFYRELVQMCEHQESLSRVPTD